MQVFRYTVFGLLLVALLAGTVYWFNRGSQVRLNAEVIRVRIVSTSDSTAVLIAELRIDNPAEVPFVVRSVTASLTAADGSAKSGDPVAQGDLDRLLGYYASEGPRFNETLKVRARLAGRTRRDWTVAVSFPLAKPAIEARRAMAFEIEDVDGVRVTLAEKR
jgi:hypothetical protein